jgi:hypothetical protein
MRSQPSFAANATLPGAGGVPKIKVRQFVAFTIQFMLTIMRSASESRLL